MSAGRNSTENDSSMKVVISTRQSEVRIPLETSGVESASVAGS